MDAWLINGIAYFGGACFLALGGYMEAWAAKKETWEWEKFGKSMVITVFASLTFLVGIVNLGEWNIPEAFATGMGIKVMQQVGAKVIGKK